MLTDDQENYLARIPRNAMARVAPWDRAAAAFGRNLQRRLEKTTGLKTFWCGSLALGIAGENDVDIYIFCEPGHFSAHLPAITETLGEPTYRLPDRILWRTSAQGYRVDAALAGAASAPVQADLFFTEALRSEPRLLREYEGLKEAGLSARTYYRRKAEFYNRVLSLRDDTTAGA